MNKGEIFTIALPAGRLAEESIEFFKKTNIAEIEIIPKSRELIIWDKNKTFKILLVRSQDVPMYLLQGGAHAGITGKDILLEKNYDLTMPYELNFGRCRLSVATIEENSKTLLNKKKLTVVTKYPQLSSDFFFKSGINCEIIKFHGSIEIAPTLGLADCIVDLVSTGTTLKENGLVEVCTILNSQAMFILSRQAYATHFEKIKEIFIKIKNNL